MRGVCEVQRSENVERPADRVGRRAERKTVRRNRVSQATMPQARPCRKSRPLGTPIFAEWRFWPLKTALLVRDQGLARADIWPRGLRAAKDPLWGQIVSGLAPKRGSPCNSRLCHSAGTTHPLPHSDQRSAGLNFIIKVGALRAGTGRPRD